MERSSQPEKGYMMPKEKAQELVDKFHNAKSDKMSDYSTIYTPTAKVCALIAVDEILYYATRHGFISLVQYWNEVKQEIEKL